MINLGTAHAASVYDALRREFSASSVDPATAPLIRPLYQWLGLSMLLASGGHLAWLLLTNAPLGTAPLVAAFSVFVALLGRLKILHSPTGLASAYLLVLTVMGVLNALYGWSVRAPGNLGVAVLLLAVCVLVPWRTGVMLGACTCPT